MNDNQVESLTVTVNVKTIETPNQGVIDGVAEFLDTIGIEVTGIAIHCDSCGINSTETFQNYEEFKAGVIALGWVNAGADDFCPKCRIVKGL